MGTGIGDVPTKPSSYELERRGEMPRRKQSKAHPQGPGTRVVVSRTRHLDKVVSK